MPGCPPARSTCRDGMYGSDCQYTYMPAAAEGLTDVTAVCVRRQ
jgi:hypothetical protein